MDQSVEAIGNGLSDHLSSWNQLGVKSVKNILQVLSFLWFFRIEQLKELLNEFVSDESLQTLDISGIINNQLEEEFINWLEMWPTWVEDDFLFFNAHIIWPTLLDDRKWSENVLLNHFHDSVKIWDDQVDNMMLIGKKITQLGNILQSLILLGDHLIVIVEIEVLATELNLLQENFFAFYNKLEFQFQLRG